MARDPETWEYTPDWTPATDETVVEADNANAFVADVTEALNSVAQVVDWTPQLTFGGATTGIVQHGDSYGKAVKIGPLVIAPFLILLTSKGTATGTAGISGLPFESASITNGAQPNTIYASGMTGVVGAVAAAPYTGSDLAMLLHTNDGSGGLLSDGHFQNASVLRGTLIYLAG